MVAANSVLIIGAGVAGIRTAELLENAGMSVTVLEGRDRVGGRMHTSAFNSTGDKIDLGAAWIDYVGEKNPVAKLAMDQDIELLRSDYMDENNAVILSEQREKLRQLLTAFENWVSKNYGSKVFTEALFCRSWLPRWLCDKFKFPDESVYDVIQKYFEQEKVDKALHASFLAVVSTALSINEVANLKDISIKKTILPLSDQWTLSGHSAFPEQGYFQVFQSLYMRFKPNIKLGHKVVEITRDDNSCTVRTVDGKVFQSDYCVCTVPLGVLKKNVIQFKPELPQEMRNAIQSHGWGTINKIALLFDDPWWKDFDKPDTQFLVRDSDPWDQNVAWLDLYSSKRQPILVVFNVATPWETSERTDYNVGKSWKTSGKTDKEVTEDAMQMLRAKFPNAPNPKEYIVTHWDTDEFAFGSYSSQSHMNTNSRETGRILSTPLPNDRLFFAGEHLFYTNPGYIFSAYRSAEYTAEQVLGKPGRSAPRPKSLLREIFDAIW
eukprot:CAMPEP_0203756192 /NCGR_PEP_ID=MMETSP0098-20131031/9502_1 /ASSEMBLY_ACC=CAM_ASM_000208 /TAXON_ID=96639 /ORGANISM=" , Strain NY0313808BC1" /LENGTH=491 /DNA_ID=CAMNT_0050647961 /DNA_START=55 /DNA_END=1527 /DNA_ORIENTATION=+